MAGLEEFALMLVDLAAQQEAEISDLVRFTRQPQNVFELPENSFVKLFRLNKRSAVEVIEFLEPHMKDCSRLSALTQEEKV